MTFTGWLREADGPWRAVVKAATWDEAWKALLRVESAAPSRERTVNTGKHPDDRRRPR